MLKELLLLWDQFISLRYMVHKWHSCIFPSIWYWCLVIPLFWYNLYTKYIAFLIFKHENHERQYIYNHNIAICWPAFYDKCYTLAKLLLNIVLFYISNTIGAIFKWTKFIFVLMCYWITYSYWNIQVSLCMSFCTIIDV